MMDAGLTANDIIISKDSSSGNRMHSQPFLKRVQKTRTRICDIDHPTKLMLWFLTKRAWDKKSLNENLDCNNSE